MKQTIIVRKDLKMSCGKIAGQVAHASLRAYWEAERIAPIDAAKWLLRHNEAKIVLKVQTEIELHKIVQKCIEAKLPFATVHDAGKTQIAYKTFTAVGIGPAKSKKLDEITKDLKLL